MSTSLIPKSFINDLLARIDIVEIIGNRVQLRKSGSNFTALCPFHTEKTPSFTVSPSKQFYYCFGCGAHGNVIGFLMDYDRLEFVDAVETLASHIGLEVPRQIDKHNQSVTQDFYQLLDKVSKYYQQQLRKADNAIAYLKSRGLSGEISKRFNIGYAPSGWDNLLTELGKTKALKSQLVTTGMLINKDNHFYDRFRERIMFPIRNQRGQVIGFGGRTLGDDTPKYLNSPETPIFNKSQELYGLYETKQTNRNLSYIIIVEGYMDVLSLAQHGITCAVATLGTATTIRHIQKLLRYTSKIIFCFDGDLAGRKAAWRALQNTLPLMRDGVQALFLFLPENEDPDSQIRKEGQTIFLQRINNAIPLSEFFFTQLIEQEQINVNTMDGRALIAQKATELLNNIPGGIFKQLMLKKLAEMVHIDVRELNDFNKINNGSRKLKSNIAQSPSLIRSAIKLLLHYPKLAEYIEDTKQIADINLPNIELLVQLLILLKQHPNITTGGILEYWRDKKEARALAKLTAIQIPIPVQNLKSEFIDIIKRLYEYGREQTIEELLNKANNGNISIDDKYKLQKLITDAKINILSEE